MDSKKLDRLYQLTTLGFDYLREAIMLSLTINEDDPGAREPGWPTMPQITEQLSLVNRVLGKLVESLPAEVEASRN